MKLQVCIFNLQMYQHFFKINKFLLFSAFDQKVFCGTYSRKGDLFMSACQDQKIRLYDTTGHVFKFKRSIRARNVGWSVLDVALSPDGYNIIYSSWCDSSKCITFLKHFTHKM